MADPADLIDIQKRSVMKAKNFPVPAMVGKISCSNEMLGLASSFAFNSAKYGYFGKSKISKLLKSKC